MKVNGINLPNILKKKKKKKKKKKSSIPHLKYLKELR